MASEDVIELGSSDEETAEPAPKKRKPPLNAMVHIPNKVVSGLTVTSTKNTKPRIDPQSVLKGSIGAAVTVTKVPKSPVNIYANAKKFKGNTKSSVGVKSGAGLKRNLQIPVQKSSYGPGPNIINSPMVFVNPMNPIMNKSSSSHILKQVGRHKISVRNIPRGIQGQTLELPIKMMKSPLNNTSLPPGITIKRTTPPSKPGLNSEVNVNNVNLPFKIQHMSNSGRVGQGYARKAVFNKKQAGLTEITTVELDDDEPTVSSGPQWYLKPENINEEEKRDMADTPGAPQDPLADSPQDPVVEQLPHDQTSDTEQERPAKKSKTSSAYKSADLDQERPTKKSSVANSPTPSESTLLEKQNNEEPDKSNFIEITIEDSPAKTTHNKTGFQVGAELAITIDDSPVRNKTNKTNTQKSDDDLSDTPKNYHSKKKLEYPKTVKPVQVVEIEFEPIPLEQIKSIENHEENMEILPTKESTNTETNSLSAKEAANGKKSLVSDIESRNDDKNTVRSASEKKKETPKSAMESIEIVEIEESPIKPIEEVKTATPKKNKTSSKSLTKPEYKMEQPIEIIDVDYKEMHEFSPIYRSFIKLCFQLENSQDMKTIVEKKIKSYYRQVPKKYTESEVFTDMVAGKIMAMKAGPEKMYLYIKDVVDELNHQRKLAKAQPPKEENEEQEKFLYGKESEFDAKRQRQIRKLEKTLKKLHRAIQKLEEEEVDFDDEEDSVYLLTESEDDTSPKDRPLNKEVLLQRYKERSVRVHAKLCQLTNTKMPSEARVHIDARPGQPQGPAKRLEKWINRKVPIGTPLPFPDFQDVLRCVREANKEDRIGWNEADIMEEARDLFVRCGKKLQRRRQENEWRLAASRMPTDALDPAEDSTDLKRKLEDNRRLAAKKETELFNKYADRQNQLKLEAVEIGDKEAEESPVESDDEVEEEVVEITDSINDKVKRKERIKRLLQKSKVSDDIGKISYKSPDDDNSSKEKSEVALKDKKENGKEDASEPNLAGKSSTFNNGSKDTVDLDSDSKSKGSKSDNDENHLLERRFFVPMNSSSDTGSAIAIDDTSSDEKTSDDREIVKQLSDVISIENSSYSESEDRKADLSEDTEKETTEPDKVFNETSDNSKKLQCSVHDVENNDNKTKNQEHNGCLEDILLASSDESDNVETRIMNKASVSETCINLRDDNISIGETMIVENREIDGSGEESKADSSDKNTITDGSSVEGMEIGPMIVISKEQNRLESIAENDTVIETSSSRSAEGIRENPVEITNIASVETIEDIDASPKTINEIINVNSVESVDNIVNDENINSVESVEDDNSKRSNVKSVEAMEQDTLIDDDEDSSRNTTKNIKEVKENKEHQKINEITMKQDQSSQSDKDSSMKVIHDVIKTLKEIHKVTENITVKEYCEVAPMEKNKETDTLDQTDKDTAKNDFSDVLNATNNTETVIKSKDNDVINSDTLQSIDDGCSKETKSTSVDTDQDMEVQNNEDTDMKEIRDVTKKGNVDKSLENTTKENNNSIPEAMEVDVGETL